MNQRYRPLTCLSALIILAALSSEAAAHAHHLRAVIKRAPRHGADRGVHPGCVAAAGEKRDAFHERAKKRPDFRKACAAERRIDFIV